MKYFVLNKSFLFIFPPSIFYLSFSFKTNSAYELIDIPDVDTVTYDTLKYFANDNPLSLTDSNDNPGDGNYVVTVPKNDDFSDAMLLWVKVSGKMSDEAVTLYMFKLYVPDPTTITKNPDTGIENVFIYIVPVSILLGSMIVLKKKRYA